MLGRKANCLIALGAALGAAGCDCGDTIEAVGDMQVTISSPTNGYTYQSGETFKFTATATNPLGVQTLTMHAGNAAGVPDTVLSTCTGSVTDLTLTCTYSFVIADHTNLIGDEEITLTADAIDPRKRNPASATVTVRVAALVCRWVQPALTTTTPAPGVADVKGTSEVEVQVVSAVPLSQVAITSAGKAGYVARWNMPSASTTDFNDMITWNTAVGGGAHTLTCTAEDTSGQVGSAIRDIVVACATDADCASTPNTRCCPTDGLCVPMVGANDDCDCDHPCQLDQGCFPGTCGQTPQKCRPGCNPGSEEVPAATCAEQPNGPNGTPQPAYCNNLPADQVTAQNMGGACAVGDACDIIQQNCPALPLNRTIPATAAGGANPPVPQTCTPVAPTTNACVPAGAIPVWGTGCNQDCNSTTDDCAKGSICVTPVDGNDNPTGPSVCRAQCDLPPGTAGGNPVSSSDCPSTYPLCQGFFGNGMIYFSSGVCVGLNGQ